MPELHMFSPDKTGPLTIDCDCCELQGTSGCDDCVVTFLLGREPDDAEDPRAGDRERVER